MNISPKEAVFNKIKEYGRIIIFRHKRPDGDAVGSTKGLREILRESYPEKEILLINNDFSDYLSFLGGEDDPRDDEFFKDALAIVIDTATVERISNPQYALCREVIKIDHHINNEPYGDIMWVEEKRSSASEMIADFYLTFNSELKINKEAAKYIYTGMITDSGRFRFASTSGETLRIAGMLLDIGIDIDTIHANLYMREFHTLKFQAYVYNQLKITENGVVYLHVTREMQDMFSLSYEDASASVSYMESIKNSLIWLAFIDNEDGSTRVRLRSRFVTINSIAEKYHGGGHACASGATVYSEEEMASLIADADAHLKEYKSENEGWL
ncbi:MAG: bifunctional oligoribonuclease/PAP phosphatase NrnA [Ruminococcaceae bacterium]|nr:bifunctional oligoribonuclease/PAP phosphatase NrnA [Oscillospiraceae bacterium]